MISFVIPAHNEEYLLADTLDQVFAAARSTREAFEVIVVDDASTDRTAAIAESHSVVLIRVNLRKISAVRNAGARHAQGDRLIFLDADTLLPKQTLHEALAALAQGAVGGGARVGVSDSIGRLPTAALILWNGVSRTLCWAAGCFLFARRDAFEAAGGFDEQYYVCEELFISQALKRQGRFVILPHPVLTSGRKARMYSFPQLLYQSARILLSGPRGFRRKQGLDLWYDAPRESK